MRSALSHHLIGLAVVSFSPEQACAIHGLDSPWRLQQVGKQVESPSNNRISRHPCVKNPTIDRSKQAGVQHAWWIIYEAHRFRSCLAREQLIAPRSTKRYTPGTNRFCLGRKQTLPCMQTMPRRRHQPRHQPRHKLRHRPRRRAPSRTPVLAFVFFLGGGVPSQMGAG